MTETTASTSGRARTARRVLLSVTAAAVASAAAGKLLPAPFIWIGLAWAAAAVAIVVGTRSTPVRLVALIAGSLAFAVSAIEATFAIAHFPADAVNREYTPRPYVNDSVLGWRLVPGQVTRSVARLPDAAIYDVSYTADSLGHRVGYPERPSASSPCALFVVCSFTFGEGVADSQTLPYRVGARTQGRVRAINGGVPAYGMEHLVAALEHPDHAPKLPCAPTHVIYQALPHHVVRAAGLVPFSLYGPRYSLTAEGALQYKGTSPPPSTGGAESGLWAQLDWNLRKSRLYRAVIDRQTRPGSLEDARLYLALVRRARDLMVERYPKASFHVLAWNIGEHYFPEGYQAFRDSLERIVPALHNVSDVLVGYDSAPQRYQIHARDQHPNAFAYDLLAGFVVDSILRHQAGGALP